MADRAQSKLKNETNSKNRNEINEENEKGGRRQWVGWNWGEEKKLMP